MQGKGGGKQKLLTEFFGRTDYLRMLTLRTISLAAVLSVISLATPSAALPSLDEIFSFGYQLQEANVSNLSTAPYQLLIIDYSKDGGAANAFTADEITTIRNAGKKVLAYLSIGEAEEYRYYFKKNWTRANKNVRCGRSKTPAAPPWLDEGNPDFCGNYKVQYWNRAWQRILYGVRSGARKSYLDRIIDAGFDGVYLDIVDGYEYWLDKPNAMRRKTAARDMAMLVVNLGRYARVVRGKSDFVIVPQNGAGIISAVSKSMKARFLGAIQGIGAEDTFFYGRRAEDNRFDPQPALRVLKRYVAAGKKVFAIDYLLNETKILEFARMACALGFIPQVANRDLDTFDTQVLSGCQCIFSESGLVC